ncbi:Cysteine sulfinic acid decarboxylase [Intoshia linei]|uniref:Cysteine sulfinic acid decarboxylase n=1 Tax=Intoshia linei TaxID=1819745 RepID=A0A177AWS8_9BILA|nr:Cysteine sulfinic acid decarboxylase [Intoshia linei]
MSEEQEFLKTISEKLIKYITEPKSQGLCNFQQPKTLEKKFDLALSDVGANYDTLITICEQVMQNSVNTGHPLFLNQLFGKVDNVSLIGAWLTSALNTSAYTFEVAPMFTLIENSILKHMSSKIGYTDGDSIFCPGGSISNMYGLNLARTHLYPEIKNVGMKEIPKLAIFLSEQAHYSFVKGAALLGFGLNCLFRIKCHENGVMSTENLLIQIEKAKLEGYQPAIVIAVSGTTITGAFDPLVQLHEICKKYNMWLHVDACLGGASLLSSKHKHLVKGIELSDSVAWNCHKFVGAAFQCCPFFTRYKNLLKKAHGASATYLFQTDKFYDVSYDTGDRSIQCGRVVDAFKLWLMWKKLGDSGLEDRVNSTMELANYVKDEIKNRLNFQLFIDEPQFVNICFWYIPEKIKHLPKTDPKYKEILSKVAPYIKKEMMMSGTCMVGYQPLADYVNFFRFVIFYSLATKSDMDQFIDSIEKYGQKFNQELNLSI